MKKNIFLIFISMTMLLFLTACSTCKPVLYSNAHYRKVGPKQAEKDIQAAINMAKQSGLDNSSSSNRTLAKSASRNAASAGISTATGSVTGAAGSGASFLIDWMFVKKSPDPLFKKHVELTLRRQGYQVIGWK